ncbi:hypothetical protein ACSQ67_023961 [Phaseolus vulgaris]
MEALWDLEDKLKISTLGAVLLLACATFALVCLCIVITLRRKAFNNKIVHQEGALDEENEKDTTTTTNTNANTIIAATASPTEWSEPSCVGWISVKRVLMGSMLWSKASKLEENMAWQRERGSPLLGLQRQGLESGWQSNNSESPVWQRPILRGGSVSCQVLVASFSMMKKEDFFVIQRMKRTTSWKLHNSADA